MGDTSLFMFFLLRTFVSVRFSNYTIYPPENQVISLCQSCNRFLARSLLCEGQALALRYRGGLFGCRNRFLAYSLHREGQALALRYRGRLFEGGEVIYQCLPGRRDLPVSMPSGGASLVCEGQALALRYRGGLFFSLGFV